MEKYGGVGKQLKVLFYDYGLSLCHALRMAEDGHQIRYFTPWASAFPNFKDYAPGLGYEEKGLEKVMYFWENVDWADLIVFPDIGAGDLAQYLRDHGKLVYGAGKGEKIENHRLVMRKLQKELGLPTQNTEHIKGVPNLRDYLKTHKNKYVKLDIFRGDVESFQAETYDKVKLYLNEIEVALGPFNETYDFLVEDFIEGCYDGETEVLTDRGWKLFKELDKTEKIATLNPETKEIAYQKPTKYIRRFDKKIFRYETNSINFAVTEDHNLVGITLNDLNCHKKEILKKIPLRKLPYLLMVKRDGKWNGKAKSEFVIPKMIVKMGWRGKQILPEIKIKMNHWLAFLGWYFSEGCVTKDGYSILIAQSNKREAKLEKIKGVLDKLPFRYNRNGHHFRINSKQLYSYLAQFGKGKSKKLPDFIKWLPQRQIKIFLGNFFEGDGSLATNRATKLYFPGVSRFMADDIQELLLKANSYGVINKRNPTGWHKYADRLVNSQSTTFEVSEHKSKYGTILKEDIEEVDYNGYTYCVNVPNHIIYVRRKGKPMWCGNCEPGFDLFFTNGQWVKPFLFGTEQSKACYLGKYVDKMPQPLQEVADKMQKFLKKIDYRGAFSTELRLGKDGIPYLIDVCARFPFPLSACYTLAIKNYSEVIYKIAQGKGVSLDVDSKYVMVAPLGSPHAKEHFIKLDFNEEYEDLIKTRVSAMLKENYYAIKGTEVVFVLCATGNDYHRLITVIEKLAKEVDAYALETDTLAGLHKIEEVTQKYQDYGLGKF